MRIYTLVSLLLGIIGATYAASSAIRSLFDGVIKRAVEGSSSKNVAQYSVNEDTVPKVISYQRHITGWYWVWILSNLIPAILLNIFVYLVVWSTILQWDYVKLDDPKQLTGQPWCYAKEFLTISSGLSVMAIIASGLSIWRAWSNFNFLNSLLVAGGTAVPIDPKNLKQP